MRVAIPSLAVHPTLESELAECPKSAKSIFIYNTGNEKFETMVDAIDIDHPEDYIEALLERGVTDFVSGKCCKDYFEIFREKGITVWKASPVIDIRDMINNFLLCGAWIRTKGDEEALDHEKILPAQ